MQKENKTYLADWLAGKISDARLRELVGETEFRAFQKLKDALENYSLPDPDMEQNFTSIRKKVETGKTPKTVKVISIGRYAAVAATILIFFGLFQLFYFSNTNQTTFGTTQTLALPDNSQVTLNARSKLSYPGLFQYNRTLKLEGEAFFEVRKGSTFTVKTALGCVKVLGTKFNVNAHSDYFEVSCYEGKVRVESMGKIAILTPTESIRFYGHTSENWAETTQAKPGWITGESVFRNVPMRYVFDQFTNQYNITVDYPGKIKDVKFTGTFTNKNKITALRSICIPLQLKYTDNGSGKIIISE